MPPIEPGSEIDQLAAARTERCMALTFALADRILAQRPATAGTTDRWR
jgi:hypothetical protein